MKLGDTKEVQVDVRFVCATNVSLKAALKENRVSKGPLLPFKQLCNISRS